MTEFPFALIATAGSANGLTKGNVSTWNCEPSAAPSASYRWAKTPVATFGPSPCQATTNSRDDDIPTDGFS